MNNSQAILDPLYGEIELSESIAALANQPVVQRLRQIRLSNIDSLGMPGIANISRYEHSIGTAVLAGRVGFRNQLSVAEKTVLEAAALLHDSAIPPFGHLIEEMFEYVDAGVSHEARWSLISADLDLTELGGVDLQIFLGRQAGLRPWATKTFGHKAESVLQEILETIKGKGRFGKCVCGDLDIDNLDNVSRAAFHMGVNADKSLSLKIAESMVQLDPEKGITFSPTAEDLIPEWLNTRRQVYDRFMLSRTDFVGKAMLLYATILAYTRGHFAKQDWIITDDALIARLTASKDKEISGPVCDWLCGELWPLSDLTWMRGSAPSYVRIAEFSASISTVLHRVCFGYRIKDKRSRRLTVRIQKKSPITLGVTHDQWLLGVCSPLKRNFTEIENRQIVEAACDFFSSEVVGRGLPASSNEPAAFSLFE